MYNTIRIRSIVYSVLMKYDTKCVSKCTPFTHTFCVLMKYDTKCVSERCTFTHSLCTSIRVYMHLCCRPSKQGGAGATDQGRRLHHTFCTARRLSGRCIDTHIYAFYVYSRLYLLSIYSRLYALCTVYTRLYACICHVYIHSIYITYIHSIFHVYIHYTQPDPLLKLVVAASSALAHPYTHTQAYTHTYMHAYMHACMYACIYIHTHTHTHTHTQRRGQATWYKGQNEC